MIRWTLSIIEIAVLSVLTPGDALRELSGRFCRRECLFHGKADRICRTRIGDSLGKLAALRAKHPKATNQASLCEELDGELGPVVSGEGTEKQRGLKKI